MASSALAFAVLAAALLGAQAQTYNYVGCFADNANDRVFTASKWLSFNSVSACRQRAVAAGATAYGLQDKTCYYGNTVNYKKYGASNGCDIPCPGSTRDQICGGTTTLSLSVYAVPPPPSPSPSPKPPSPRRTACYSCQGYIDTSVCNNAQYFTSGTPRSIASNAGVAVNWLATTNPYWAGKEDLDIATVEPNGWTFCLDAPEFAITSDTPAQPADLNSLEQGCKQYHIATADENAGDCLALIETYSFLQPAGWTCSSSSDYFNKKTDIEGLNTQRGFFCPPCQNGLVYQVGYAICIRK